MSTAVIKTASYIKIGIINKSNRYTPAFNTLKTPKYQRIKYLFMYFVLKTAPNIENMFKKVVCFYTFLLVLN